MNRTIRYCQFVSLFFILILAGRCLQEYNAYAAEASVPDNMVLVPAGKFLYGESKKEITLKAFYIDKFEVTNEDYKKFQPEYAFSSTEAKLPVREISWFDAVEYCKSVGKRLPTEEEWEKAARGTDGRMYPWGNTYDPKKTNASEQGGAPVAVGSFGKGVSPYGVHDMSGNVWEWTDSWYGDDKRYRVARGGSYFESGQEMGSVIKKLRSIPDDIHEYIGFRCAKSAE